MKDLWKHAKHNGVGGEKCLCCRDHHERKKRNRLARHRLNQQTQREVKQYNDEEASIAYYGTVYPEFHCAMCYEIEVGREGAICKECEWVMNATDEELFGEY